jgi:hypothetical protein
MAKLIILVKFWSVVAWLMLTFVNGASAASFWEHNGSIVTLEADGSNRKFSYATPKPELPVRAGTVVFQGTKSGNTYSGTAYGFSKKCGTVSYPVTGVVSADEKTVTMTGTMPLFDSSCNRAGSRADTLVFTFQRKDETPASAQTIPVPPASSEAGTAELPQPPKWTGALPTPSKVCPNSDDKFRNAKFIVICKHAEIGSVTNLKAFSPQAWEDKNDPDWAFLKQYWRTGKQFYFAREICEAGDTEFDARASAHLSAASLSKQTAAAWDTLLKNSKFRPTLGFQRETEALECRLIKGPSSDVVSSAEEERRREEREEAQRRRQQEAEDAAERRRLELEREQARRTLVVEVRSLDKYTVHLNFRAPNRNNVWPGGSQIWPLRDSEFHTYRLSCVPGEKICYGAERSGNKNAYWGIGLDGRRGCTQCCMTCGSSHRLTLNGAPDGPAASNNRRPPSSNNTSGVLDSVIDLLGAVSGVAGAVNGGRNNSGSSPQFRPAPRNSPSTITGGR